MGSHHPRQTNPQRMGEDNELTNTISGYERATKLFWLRVFIPNHLEANRVRKGASQFFFSIKGTCKTDLYGSYFFHCPFRSSPRVRTRQNSGMFPRQRKTHHFPRLWWCWCGPLARIHTSSSTRKLQGSTGVPVSAWLLIHNGWNTVH